MNDYFKRQKIDSLHFSSAGLLWLAEHYGGRGVRELFLPLRASCDYKILLLLIWIFPSCSKYTSTWEITHFCENERENRKN